MRDASADGREIFTVTIPRSKFIMPVQNFGGFPSKNRGKSTQNLARFQTTSNLDGEYLQNG